MKIKFLSLAALSAFVGFSAASLSAQPSFSGPMPSTAPVQRADQRRTAYLDRVDEVLTWRAGLAKLGDSSLITDMGIIVAKLARHEDADLCSRSVIALMKEPGSGPFWMFPTTCIAYLGQGQLSPAAQAAIRDAWRTTLQLRGDTENHWAMYYTSLYLMSELYPDEPPSAWYSGKSSTANRAEAREYLFHWMDLATTIGQGEFNPTHYIGEYAIPMLYLATWAKDPAMRVRGHMMLDWLLADHAANTLRGVLRGPNARTDDTSLIERWNALASFFSWIMFGNTPPTAAYGGWGIYFAVVAKNYELPEVIYRIATDRDADYIQRDLKRTRRRWRNSDVLMAPIYKTSYMRSDYAVGSYQGGISDPIQTHVWDVTWAVADPRGVHNTMFSMHPISSSRDMQMYFTELPDQMIKGVVSDKARGVFQGRIVVAHGADQTDAKMKHDALVLSDQAEVDAKPELEIYADDVSCTHGNTVGALDEEAMFYAAQRGIPEEMARAMLTRAFVETVVDRIEHDAGREVARSWIANRLGAAT